MTIDKGFAEGIAKLGADSVGAGARTVNVAAATGPTSRTFALIRTAGTESFVELKPDETEAAADMIECSTLQAIVDYLEENRDGLDLSKINVRVVDEAEVSVIGPLRVNRDRETFATATPASGDPVSEFLGKSWSQDDFVLKAQLLFAPGEDRAALLALVGNLTDEAVRIAIDDGVTQQVATRQGTKVGPTAVKSPVFLVPLRSFPEITLAPVPFVVRVKNNGPGTVSTIALHDASGGVWRVDAIKKIAAFIEHAAGDERKFGIIV